MYIIWGAGRNGRVLYEIIGSDSIAAFIDENPSVYEYKDKKVIDFQTYIEQFSSIPIIISAVNYEEEIEQKLSENHIDKYYKYSEYMEKVLRFFCGIDINRMLERLHVERQLFIGGEDLLADLIESFFVGKIPEVIRLKQSGTVSLGCKENEQVGIEEILAQKELFYRPENERFKDIHKKKRCFIVGNGPSLTMKDLDCLADNHEICFGVNGIFKAFNNTKWRPTYYIVSDPDGVIQWKEDILSLEADGIFVANAADFFTDEEKSRGSINIWNQEFAFEDGKPLFSKDFSKVSYNGDTITYDGALQLAVYMGFDKIYLIGTDCCKYANGKQHFSEDYHDMNFKKSEIHEDKQTLAYISAREYSEKNNISIYNATRGGMLEVFERVDFDSLF